ncbi:hypothetical protein [uncultured Pseudomonas sp.]|uniref:hypothetical protein n=1 Tax=uncultured Pseudomonas sp. TaxID=114707 RepID=UPI0025910B92|nr:hypothetical protein [uncultured Pseudomonas sp.]
MKFITPVAQRGHLVSELIELVVDPNQLITRLPGGSVLLWILPIGSVNGGIPKYIKSPGVAYGCFLLLMWIQC